MPEWIREVGQYFKAVIIWWFKTVGGAVVTVFQICYALRYREAPPMISWCLFGACFTIAGFLAWRDERKKVLELTRPNLRGHIVSVGLHAIGNGSALTVLLQITNSGPATIADDFTAILKCGELTRRLSTVHLPPNASFSDESGKVMHIDPSDMLYEKLIQPIPAGGRVSGFLFYVVKDVLPSLLTGATRYEITICFKDASPKRYFATNQGPSQKTPLYEPGVRDPFVSLNSGREKPLTGIRLRNECDKWIASGKAIYNRLHFEGEVAIPEAKQWLLGFKEFTELNLTVSDIDMINAFQKVEELAGSIGIPVDHLIHPELSTHEPSQEVEMYKTLVANKFGRLSVIRNKIK
jgi:hypothetical protein